MVASILKFEEGLRLSPYLDDKGYLTVGYGTLMSYKLGLDPDEFVFKITEEMALMLLEADLAVLRENIAGGKHADVFNGQPLAVQHILLSMGYQMGYRGLLGFKNMWKALDKSNYGEAAKHALDSKWAREDSSARAYRHAAVIRERSMAPYKDLIPGIL